LIKSADFFERASDVDTLILDKTGTVTVGHPTITTIEPVRGVAEDELLRVAAACGFGSLHPVSRAVVAAALARGITSQRPDEVKERPGMGVVAQLDGRRAALGRRALLAELGIDAGAQGDDDVSQVWVAIGTTCLGRLVLRDQPRADAHDALAAMKALGLSRLILLTGDRATAARAVGEVLGMDQVIAEVLPAQKLEVVKAEQAAGHVVMMVGDGVNDALALGGADVGVAIGAELNEVALGGADVALLGTDLGRLPKLIRLADTTRSVIGQNVWIAFGFSMVLIGFAAAGVLDPLKGALAQSVAVLVVVANSARILRLGDHGPGVPPEPASPPAVSETFAGPLHDAVA
jgi:P-type E1-E2 ATPase